MRSANNAWPIPSELADAGVPPFAPDPTRRRAYEWRLNRAGTLVNYLGIPKTGDAPAWLIVVQEPEPGVPPDQPFEDQEHHRLLSGAMLHVATWTHENGQAVADRIVRFARAVGGENVIAGADCGFATFAGSTEIHPSVVWAKFAALVEGARLATKQLWGRS